MFLSFVKWWYGTGWLGVVQSLSRRTRILNENFSTKSLLRTLFSPWRRIITYPGKSLGDKFRAWGDNLFSRVIGFFVRLFVLMAAGLALIVVFVVTLAEAVVWPLLPIAWIGFLFMAVMG